MSDYKGGVNGYPINCGVRVFVIFVVLCLRLTFMGRHGNGDQRRVRHLDIAHQRWQVMKEAASAFWKNLTWPGLTPSSPTIRDLAAQIPVHLAALAYKRSNPFLWVVFVGGTGTGKSTLFNALIGEPLSAAGVERPKTGGPLVYAHKSTPVDNGFPFAPGGIQRVMIDQVPPSGFSGRPGQLLVLDHDREELAHLVIVDTPDFDSIEIRNRQMVADLELLADVVIFVASQEKYADDVPFRFLTRLHLGAKPYYLLLNKAEDGLTAEEVLEGLNGQGLQVSVDRFWMLPYLRSQPASSLADAASFSHFKGTLLRHLGKAQAPELIRRERRRAEDSVRRAAGLLLDLLQQEADAASKWMERLQLLFEVASQNLLAKQEERFVTESRAHVQREIRKHFSKYDLLATPRRFVSEIIRTPLRLLGLWPGDQPPHSEQDLMELFRTADLSMIQAAVESFNRSVLEKLSPPNQDSALHSKLRDPALLISTEEIQQQTKREQDHLVRWLEDTFQRLAEGIPKSKEVGIYSTSILWGALIIALETAIGGGISLLEAVLDTAVAPFVTKGAVDLFAYHELQEIVRELGEHYRKALTVSLRMQVQRYREGLQVLMVSPQTLQEVRSIWRSIEIQSDVTH